MTFILVYENPTGLHRVYERLAALNALHAFTITVSASSVQFVLRPSFREAFYIYNIIRLNTKQKQYNAEIREQQCLIRYKNVTKTPATGRTNSLKTFLSNRNSIDDEYTIHFFVKLLSTVIFDSIKLYVLFYLKKKKKPLVPLLFNRHVFDRLSAHVHKTDEESSGFRP